MIRIRIQIFLGPPGTSRASNGPLSNCGPACGYQRMPSRLLVNEQNGVAKNAVGLAFVDSLSFQVSVSKIL
jgi:hypothetical protein